MTVMVEVYSLQKPARAWRGAVATAFVLAATTAAGWLLIRGKQAGRPVELSEPADLDSPSVRLQAPRGWTGTFEKIDEMEVALFAEPASRRVLRRVLCVAGWPSSYAPARQFVLTLKERLVRIGLGLYRPVEEGRPSPVGPLAGWQIKGIWVGLKQRGELVSRLAVGPAGRVYLLALRSSGPLRRADLTFFDAVCGSLELPGLRLSDSLERASRATGIHFDVPAASRVVEPNDLQTARVTLVGGSDDEDAWRITVFRTWARPGNDLESLVAAYRAERLQDLSLAGHIEQRSVGVNTAWRTAARLPEDWPETIQSSLEVWAVRHRDGLSAMIVGQSSGTGQMSLRALCEGIARSLRLTPNPLAPDETQAETVAAQIVSEITQQGIDHWWRRGPQESWFLLSSRHDSGFIWHRRSGAAASSPGAYVGGGITLIRYRFGNLQRDRTDLNRWSIDPDGMVFSFEQFIPALGDKDEPVRLIDSRRPGANEVKHYIEIESRRYQGTLTTPDNFLPDPLLELGLYLLARHRPAGVSALFAVIGSSEKMLHRRMCRSLGRLTDEDDGRGGPVFGVTTRLDYEPTPSRYLFDDRGDVVRVERGNHYVATRTSRPVIDEQLDPSIVSDAIESWRRARWLTAGPPSTRPGPPG